MSKAELRVYKKHSPRWLLNKIESSKHDGERLMYILEFQKVIGDAAIKSRVNDISDEEIEDMTDMIGEKEFFEEGAKWFKNKILKQ